MSNNDTISLKEINDVLKESVKNISLKVKSWHKAGMLDEEKLKYMLEREVIGNHSRKNRKGVKNLIDSLLNPKKKNGSREDGEIKYIVESLNTNNELGKKLKLPYFETFGKKIVSARKTSGRSKHNDFEILLKGEEEWKRIEHKGCRKLKNIDEHCKPWGDSCQFYNGDPKPFNICKKYARVFWNNLIKSGILTQKYDIKSDIPKFNTWLKDAFRQGKPLTKFVKELREKSIETNGTASLFEERKTFNKIFVENIDEKDLKSMIRQIQPIYDNVMKNKDYWLKINGDIYKEFRFKWFEQKNIPKILKIEIIKNKLDPIFKCICDDDTSFIAHLRWGYNQGITNIRLDLK